MIEIMVGELTEWADRCDLVLNHDGKRIRVEDRLGRQKVNWEIYKEFERSGMVLLLIASEGDELAGFAMYLIYKHPNHPDALIGHCQFLIVPPKHRSKGLGRSLIKRAEAELRLRNCTHIMHGRRMVYDIEPLFTKIGFEKVEESYIKELS